jgi:hypothetical protein
MSDFREGKPRESWSYSGEVWTDGAGRAVVVLPPFARMHRHGFEYELDPLAPSCAATVAEEVVDDRFAIATDRPHVKVAWRLTPVRSSEVELSQ